MRALLVIMTFTCVAWSATAANSPYSCKLYAVGDSSIPSDIRLAFDLNVAAINYCSISDSHKSYEALSRVERGVQGACVYSRRSVFKIEEKGLVVGWSFHSPHLNNNWRTHNIYMMVSDGECREPGNEQYTLIESVSEGTFFALENFWKAIVSVTTRDQTLIDTPLSVKSSEEYQHFLKALKVDEQKRVTISRVGLSEVNEVNAFLYYKLFVSLGGSRWSLAVDFFDGRGRLLGVNRIE